MTREESVSAMKDGKKITHRYFGGTQRKFPANRIPKDLSENEAKVRQWVEEGKKKIDGPSHSLT